MPVTPLAHRVLLKSQNVVVPLLPVVVVASFKGGVWKTSIACSLAERLAWAGLRVLLFVSDKQQDAKFRLGVATSTTPTVTVKRGSGSVTLVCAQGPYAIDLLYRKGPAILGQGDFHVAVVDTPPGVEGGLLPGASLIVPTDGDNTSTNLVVMLRKTPRNTDVILVRVGSKCTPETIAEWESDTITISNESGLKKARSLPNPIPRSDAINAALHSGTSVWSLPRHGHILAYLNAVEALAAHVWRQKVSSDPMPDIPSSNAAAAFVQGWDEDA